MFVGIMLWLYLITRVGWLEFNVPFQHKYGYIRDEFDNLPTLAPVPTNLHICHQYGLLYVYTV